MNGNEFLQTSHLPKSEHRPFSTSKRQMRVVGPVVNPASRFLSRRIADDLHCSAVRAQSVGQNDIWFAAPFHRFPAEFQCCFAVAALGNGPSLYHQKRTVSWLISILRSCSRSSTLRSENGNRTYIIAARPMVSGDVLKYLNGSHFVIR